MCVQTDRVWGCSLPSGTPRRPPSPHGPGSPIPWQSSTWTILLQIKAAGGNLCREISLISPSHAGAHVRKVPALLGTPGDSEWLRAPQDHGRNPFPIYLHGFLGAAPRCPGSGPPEGRGPLAEQALASQARCPHLCHSPCGVPPKTCSPLPFCSPAPTWVPKGLRLKPWAAADGSCPKELPHLGTHGAAVCPRLRPWGPSQGNRGLQKVHPPPGAQLCSPWGLSPVAPIPSTELELLQAPGAL